jgi:hypothetical protein
MSLVSISPPTTAARGLDNALLETFPTSLPMASFLHFDRFPINIVLDAYPSLEVLRIPWPTLSPPSWVSSGKIYASVRQIQFGSRKVSADFELVRAQLELPSNHTIFPSLERVQFRFCGGYGYGMLLRRSGGLPCSIDSSLYTFE